VEKIKIRGMRTRKSEEYERKGISEERGRRRKWI
jgi:hypothetical protein